MTRRFKYTVRACEFILVVILGSVTESLYLAGIGGALLGFIWALNDSRELKAEQSEKNSSSNRDK